MAVRFHLPGLRYNYPLNMLLLSLMKKHPEYFREGVEIASFFGEFPVSLWNGGRLSAGDQCDARFVTEVIKNINGQGIPIRYTYTNPLLEEKDLAVPYCNFCMKAADNGMNQVLVVSEILENYIRKEYPGYRINSSTCKEIKDPDQLNRELEKEYNLVVLDYNLNNRFEILEKIERKDKCELLVNALCIPGCPRRGDHYKNIARNERIILGNRSNPQNRQIPVIPWKCEYGDRNHIYSIQNYCTFISPDAIWERYVPMGFTEFKIEGRTANLFSLIETYSFYLAKPESAGEVRLKLLTNLENSRVITVHKPRPGKWP